MTAHPIKGGSHEVEDLDKASGLDLSEPQGALAEGQCGLGNDDYEVEDLDKASGLDLSEPQGALAEGQCGLGNDDNKRMGLVEGQYL